MNEICISSELHCNWLTAWQTDANVLGILSEWSMIIVKLSKESEQRILFVFTDSCAWVNDCCLENEFFELVWRLAVKDDNYISPNLVKLHWILDKIVEYLLIQVPIKFDQMWQSEILYDFYRNLHSLHLGHEWFASILNWLKNIKKCIVLGHQLILIYFHSCDLVAWKVPQWLGRLHNWLHYLNILLTTFCKFLHQY